MTVDHPQFGTMCCICFAKLDTDTCVVDTDGVKWDVCPGICAQQAGITERGTVPSAADMLKKVDELRTATQERP